MLRCGGHTQSTAEIDRTGQTMERESETGSAAVHTITAKTLIVGDSGVGKTSLVRRLETDSFSPFPSTHGATIVRIAVAPLEGDAQDSPAVKREIELWDLAGRPDYNAVHQIFMEDATAAIVVVDAADSPNAAVVSMTR